MRTPYPIHQMTLACLFCQRFRCFRIFGVLIGFFVICFLFIFHFIKIRNYLRPVGIILVHKVGVGTRRNINFFFFRFGCCIAFHFNLCRVCIIIGFFNFCFRFFFSFFKICFGFLHGILIFSFIVISLKKTYYTGIIFDIFNFFDIAQMLGIIRTFIIIKSDTGTFIIPFLFRIIMAINSSLAKNATIAKPRLRRILIMRTQISYYTLMRLLQIFNCFIMIFSGLFQILKCLFQIRKCLFHVMVCFGLIYRILNFA